MSLFFRIQESNLVIKKSECKAILLDVQKANEEWDRKELKDIKSMKKLLEYFGLEYDDLDDFTERTEYKILESEENTYQVYEFKEFMDIIAKNIDNTKTFNVTIYWQEYEEKEKWIFHNGERKVLKQKTIFE